MRATECEVCGKEPALPNDILCRECADYYTILLDLIQKDPDSVQRLKEVYEWRKKKFHDAARREKASGLVKLFH